MARTEDAGPEIRSRRGSGWLSPERLGVLWFSLLFVAAVGVKNGAANQNKYLLAGLRLADPGFLPGDWFTGEVLHPQRAFTLLVAAMAYTGKLNLALALGAVLQSGIFAVASYLVVRAVYDRPLIPWAATLALFASMRTVSVGSVYWILPFLEASTIAGVAFVVALACLARGRAIAAGGFLGVAALFHGHFFALSLPVLVAASMVGWLERERRRLPVRVAVMWGLFLLLAAPAIFAIVQFATAPGADEIRWLNAALFPYHVAPWTWSRDPVIVLAAATLFGLGGVLLRPAAPDRNLVVALGLIALAVFASLALAWFRVGEFMVELWPWRLSPIVLFAGLAAGVASLPATGSWGLSGDGRARLGLGLLLGALVILATLCRPPVSHVLLVVAALPAVQWLADAAMARLARGRSLRSGWLVGLWITLAFWPSASAGLRQSHVDFEPSRAEPAGLYEWIRSGTPESAMFAVPPSWEGFRLNARRPVVADWKSIPRYPPNRIAWLERMRALTGLPEIGADPADLDAGFLALDCDRAAALREQYGVQYIVLDETRVLECAELTHEAGGYRVWRLVGPGGGR